MHKYLALFRSNLSNSLEYRGALVTWILVEIVSLISAIFLWTAAFRTNSQIGPYFHSQILLYYFLIPVIGSITSVFVSETLPKKIKDGSISNEILKPYNFSLAFFINHTAIKLIQLTLKIPIYFIVGVLLFSAFKFSLDLVNLSFALLIALFSYLLYFILDFTISLTAFWMDDTWALNLLRFVAMLIFGGLSFPLDLIPSSWRFIFQLLPFHLVYYFPVGVAMDKFSPSAIAGNFLQLLAWLIFFSLLSFYLWSKGIKKYGAYGQ